ncbi:hypothetical protein HNR00_005138 [Methylorubrum rhodinum]|uniref:Uncharacterized protein n=1 Tax=Methylorubrum rhodinum TaxID=29428 RepID=A0A840ZTJ6_9HYPH|nr:hypothetical protein [Methylorubrum rhodinum]MBB5760388.1 hypothetical protein [Methylorubrum rhodinum]
MIDIEPFVVVGVVAALLLLFRLVKGRSSSEGGTPASGAPPKPAASVMQPSASPGPTAPSERDRTVLRAFRNVFAMMHEPRRQQMIQTCMRANSCSKTEAMEILLDEHGAAITRFD